MDVSVRDGRHTGDASKGGCEMSQTTAGLAKNCLHPGFPGLAATETLRTARGHPGEARRGACAGPRRTAISERAVPRSPPRRGRPPAPSRSARLRAPPCPGSWGRDAARNTRLFRHGAVARRGRKGGGGGRRGRASTGALGREARPWLGWPSGEGPPLQPRVLQAPCLPLRLVGDQAGGATTPC